MALKLLSYIFAIIIAFVFARYQTYPNVDDFIKLFTVYAASMTAIFGVYITVTRQAKTSRDIEVFKNKLLITNNAYTELLGAMQKFHDVLDQEKSNYSKAAAKNADDLLSNTSHLIERLNSDCEKSFTEFHQKLRCLREQFEKINSNDKRVILWKNEKKNVERLWMNFLNKVKEHHPEIANPND